MLRSLLIAALFVATGLVAQERHVHTDRNGSKLLPLPKQDDCFFFAIFGDRTGGKPSGLKILRQAVADTNLLDPDLVMTVGDLVEGYNKPKQWLEQTREFKAIMGKLRMKWFPVAGNHDIYGPTTDGKNFAIHTANYEKHFGPLWYWFEHKNSAFVVLYSDEGDPKTGRASYKEPALQKMSPAQFAWLKKTLEANNKRDHVFVFLHHPRWHKGNYGDDWDKVHKALVAAGNVSAVFAGHIHHMVYAGKKDGIEYFTLAATGSNLSKKYPKGAGYLHHFNIVTVRKDGIRVSTLPVGTVIDPKLLTQEVIANVRKLTNAPNGAGHKPLALESEGRVDDIYTLVMRNPTTRPVEFTLIPESTDPRWSFIPDHIHLTVAPGKEGSAPFSVARAANTVDSWFAIPRIRIQADYLAPGVRIAVHDRSVIMQVVPPASAGRPKTRGYMTLAKGAYLETPSAKLGLSGEALTVDAFVGLTHLDGRHVIVSDQDFQLFIVDGKPTFRVTTDKGAQTVIAEETIPHSVWNHIAGVFNGRELQIYVNGKRIASEAQTGRMQRLGKRTLIAASVDAKGQVTDFLWGRIDEVRIADGVWYRKKYEPPMSRKTGFEANDATALLLHLDRPFGPWTVDASTNQAHPRRHGIAEWAPDRQE